MTWSPHSVAASFYKASATAAVQLNPHVPSSIWHICCLAGRLAANANQQPKGGPNGVAGSGSSGVLWRLRDILARPDEFRRVLSREVLSGKQVVMAGVVMLEAPADAVHLQVSDSWRQRLLQPAAPCKQNPAETCCMQPKDTSTRSTLQTTPSRKLLLAATEQCSACMMDSSIVAPFPQQ